jgi:hypothetical protein
MVASGIFSMLRPGRSWPSLFQSATTLTIKGKSASVTFKDANTLPVVTPSLAPGPQQVTITNPNGETVSLGAALTANQVGQTFLSVRFLFRACVLTFSRYAHPT